MNRSSYMNQSAYTKRSRTASIALAATPVAIFAAYIAWIVVPIVVAEVVPAVVRALTAN